MASGRHLALILGALLWLALAPTAFGAAGEYVPSGGFRVSTGFLPVVQSSGRVLDAQGASVRGLRADGSVDASFAGDGTLDLDAPVAGGRPVLLPNDGFLVGTADSVRRFLPNGEPDSAFGSNGVATVGGVVRVVLVEPSGRVLVVSEVDGGVVVSALLTTGQLDPAFGGAGRQPLAGLRTASAAALTATGVAVAGQVPGPIGWGSLNASSSSRLVLLSRDGSVIATSATLDAVVRRIRFMRNGDFLLVGTAYSRNEKGATGSDAVLLRVSDVGVVRAVGRINFDEDWLSLGSSAYGVDAMELTDGRFLLLATNTFDDHLFRGPIFFTARFTSGMEFDETYGAPPSALTYHPEMRAAGYRILDGELRDIDGAVEVTMYPCREASCTVPRTCGAPSTCAVAGRIRIDATGRRAGGRPTLKVMWTVPRGPAVLAGSIRARWTTRGAQLRRLVAVHAGTRWFTGTTRVGTIARTLRAGVNCIDIEVLDVTFRTTRQTRCVGRPYGIAGFTSRMGWTVRRGRDAYLGAALRAQRSGASVTVDRPGTARLLSLVVRTCPGCGQIDVLVGRKAHRYLSLDGKARTRIVSIPLLGRDNRTRIRVSRLGRGVELQGVVVTCGANVACS